ncbi:MAG: hypothetical protein FWG50_02315 [Kiritimatiellaeota bacterium]|nr:hypothetical protein [Kiritimatiellota bacterium]
MKTSISTPHWRTMRRISSQVSSRASTTRVKPRLFSASTPSRLCAASWVLAWRGSDGKCSRMRRAMPRSWTITPSGARSARRSSVAKASSISASQTSVLKVT